MSVTREPGEAVLVDLAKLVLVKRVPTVKQAEYWADILKLPQFAIAGPERRFYSAFSHLELRMLYTNTTGKQPPDADYATYITAVAHVAEELPVDETNVDILRKRLGREPAEFQHAPEPVAVPRAAGAYRAPWEAPVVTPPPAASAAPARAPRAVRQPGDSITRPKGGATGAVWDICDKLSAECGGIPDRKAVVAAAEAQGLSASTTSVQYGKWKLAYKG